MALQVETSKEVHQWYDWLKQNDIDVIGPTNHERAQRESQDVTASMI